MVFPLVFLVNMIVSAVLTVFYHPLDMSDSKVSHAHESKEYKEGKLLKENKA